MTGVGRGVGLRCRRLAGWTVMVKVTRSLGLSQLSSTKVSDKAPSPVLAWTRAKTLPDVPSLSAPCCGRSAAGMGGLPGGRLLGILNPNSAHSNTTWPPDATVAVCFEPPAAHAGIAAPTSRHTATSHGTNPLTAPEVLERRRVGKKGC